MNTNNIPRTRFQSAPQVAPNGYHVRGFPDFGDNGWSTLASTDVDYYLTRLESDDLGPALVRPICDPGCLLQIAGHHRVTHCKVESHRQRRVPHLYQVEQARSTCTS